jgi:hypothetical protein
LSRLFILRSRGGFFRGRLLSGSRGHLCGRLFGNRRGVIGFRIRQIALR